MTDIQLMYLYIWAKSWENLFMPYASNKGEDQPAHLRSLISIFVVRCLDHIIPILAKSKNLRLELASVAQQGSWSHTWSQHPEDRFSHDVAHFMPRNQRFSVSLISATIISKRKTNQPIRIPPNLWAVLHPVKIYACDNTVYFRAVRGWSGTKSSFSFGL